MLNDRDLRRIIEVGIDLTTEDNRDRLLEKILKSAMDISRCDAGTLYLYQNNALVFKIMKTLSQGVSRGEHGDKIDLPPVPLKEGNVCAYSAIHKTLVNIADVYHSERFDFSGPKKYDSITGYRTQSMLVIPMQDADGTLVGVLQLMNAQDDAGNVVPFSEDDEFIIRSLSSMTAITLLNMLYLEEIKAQMHSFVSAFATAVDERTPYNGSHTKKVTVYAGILARYINALHEAGECADSFDENRLEQLELASTLHDIGKMIVPLSVMNKQTRLEERLERVESRFALIRACSRIALLEGRLPQADWETVDRQLTEDLEFIRQADGAGFLPDEKLARVNEIAARTWTAPDGTVQPWLTEEERQCLCIRKGTLTDEERRIMESHVLMTEKILSRVHFNHSYANVARFAASHHEMLNGSGYPRHLKGEQLELESRILAVVDIFDALTSTDRPYKKPIPRPKAFAILRSMVDEGKLEGRLVDYLEAALTQVDEEEISRRAAAL